MNLGKLCSVTDQVPRAISYLEKAHNLILLDSSISELLSDVAYEFLQLGQNRKAIEVMKKILELNPSNESTMMELGVAYHETGDFEQALAYFKSVIDDSCLIIFFQLIVISPAFFS